ncbi:MAG: NAD-dependent epimerase/dehydratase family protein [Alphaproteobacteria bacterium]|nr:NAD-dependent epimerase/dehydratase family protein [Alphaproteobacteria bacterium]
MRYLVTGGCGFIGSHLVEALLAAGHRVEVLDDLSTGHRRNLDPRAGLKVGDVADGAVFAEAANGIDGIFHLAAVASVQRCLDEWQRSSAVNLGGTINALDAARRPGGAGIPVVFASSAAIYGDAGPTAVDESAAPKPISFYGADKLGGEYHARIASALVGVPSTALRFFNVYGPRQDPSSPYSGVISIFADRLSRGDPVTVFGDGGQVRDFIFVSDVVRHLIAAMKRLHGRDRPGFDAYNVCTGRPTTIERLIAALAEVLDIAPQVASAPARAGDIRVSIGNPQAARRDLGFSADTTLGDGLATLLGRASTARSFAIG